MQISVSDFHTLITTFFILNQKVYFVNRKAWNPWDKGLTLWFLFCFPHTLITNQLLYRLSYISLSLWSAWISPERELFYHSFLLPSTGYFQFPQAVYIRRFLYNTICILQEVLQNFSLPFALFSEHSLECIGFCQENLLGFTQEISTISVIIFCWLPVSPSRPPRFSFT